MLSSLVKLVKSIFRSSDNNDGSVDAPFNGLKPETSCDNQDTRWSFRGHVTDVHGACGMIDDHVYFNIDSLRGSSMPNVGATVDVVAQRKHNFGGWRASSVSVVSEPTKASTEWDDEQHQDDSGITARESHSHFTGLVTKLLPDGSGLLEGYIEFKQADIAYDDYTPQKGDWVTAVLSFDVNTGCSKAKDIKPLRVRHFEGVITAIKHGSHGYILGDIYFTRSSCKGFEPSRFDKVTGEAVEISHRTCQWRAFIVQEVKHGQVNYSEYSSFESSEGQENIQSMLDDKSDVEVSQVDFGQLVLGEKQTCTMSVRNNSTLPIVLRDCQLHGGSSQFTVSEPVLEDTETPDKSKQRVDSLLIEPSKTAVVTVECHAVNLGHEDRLVIFYFEGFTICGCIKVDVTDSSEALLKPSAPYCQSKKSVRPEHLGPSTWVVPGQKPLRPGVTRLPQSIKQYPVPHSMRKWIEDKENLNLLIPVLTEPLSMSNYTRKFSALLHLEELAMEEDMKQYDMDRVCLEPYLNYMMLDVPGLAEGRPSLLVGDRVYLSSPDKVQQGPIYEGFIHEVRKETILLKFNEEFHKSYNGEEYYLTFTFNRTLLRRSHKAVEHATQLGTQVLFPCKKLIRKSQLNFKSSNQDEERGTGSLQYFNISLNDHQRAAVWQILNGHSRPTPYILYGPPGTGKTVTLVEAILQIFTHLPYSRIMACTPSNSAADLLTERLHDSGLIRLCDMIRLNAFQRQEQAIPESILPYCSDGNDIERVIHYRIIVCTCSTAGLIYLLGPKTGHFTHIFVDEAGQATEPECMVPIGLIAGTDGQIVLAGDPMQLGPVLRSNYAKSYGLGQSFLERLSLSPLYSRDEDKFADCGNYDPHFVTKLINNYRSHPSILHIPSELFYSNELQTSADPKVTECFCSWNKLTNNDNFPVLFHGIRGTDMQEGSSPSWFNPMEAVQVLKYLNALINNDVHPLKWSDIGVITPYRKQVEKIRLLMNKLGTESVKVGSVEEFQGQERLAIIISTVRSNESGISHDVRYNLGFVSNPKRFNVALTRAQALLIIIGNPHVLVKDPCWKIMIQYCVHNGAYTGCDLPSELIPGTVCPGQSKEITVLEQVSADSTQNMESTVTQLPVTCCSPSQHSERVWSDGVLSVRVNVTEDMTPHTTASQTTQLPIMESSVTVTCQSSTAVSHCSITPSMTSAMRNNTCASSLFNQSSTTLSSVQPCGTSPIVTSHCTSLSSDTLLMSQPSAALSLQVTPASIMPLKPPHSGNVELNDSCQSFHLESSSKRSIDTNSSSADHSVGESMHKQSSSQELSHIEVSVSAALPTEPSMIAEVEGCSLSADAAHKNELPIVHQPVSRIPTQVSTKKPKSDAEPMIMASSSSPLAEHEKQTSDFVKSSLKDIEPLCPLPKESVKESKSVEEMPTNLNCPTEPMKSLTKPVQVKSSPVQQYESSSIEHLNRNLPPGPSQTDPLPEDISGLNQSSAQSENRDLKSSGSQLPQRDSTDRETKSDAKETSTPIEALDVPAALKRKIITQVEYYFGDINLQRDKFLLDKMHASSDQYVPLSVIMTFNRMKSLTTNLKVVSDVLRQSSSRIIEVHPDGVHIRRNPQRPLPVDLDTWKKDMKSRSIAVEGLPGHLDINAIEDMFEGLATVQHVERGIRKYLGNKRIQTADLIIFTSEEEAEKVDRKSQEFFSKYRLAIYYKDKLSSYCVQRFFAKRINQKQRSQHPPDQKDCQNQAIHPDKNDIKNSKLNSVKKNCAGDHSYPASEGDLDLESNKNRFVTGDGAEHKENRPAASSSENNSKDSESDTNSIGQISSLSHESQPVHPSFGRGVVKLVGEKQVGSLKKKQNAWLESDNYTRHGQTRRKRCKARQQTNIKLSDTPLSSLDLNHMTDIRVTAGPSAYTVNDGFTPHRRHLSEEEFINKALQHSCNVDLSLKDLVSQKLECYFKSGHDSEVAHASNGLPSGNDGDTQMLFNGERRVFDEPTSFSNSDIPYDGLEQTESDVIVESSDEEIVENWT